MTFNFSILSFAISLIAHLSAMGQSVITLPEVKVIYRHEARILNTDHMLIPENHVSHLNISADSTVITNEMMKEDWIKAYEESNKMEKAGHKDSHPKLKIIVKPDATMYESMPDIISNYDIEAIPVFIYNPNPISIEIETQESGLIMIQEAKDQNGKWKPIEYYTFSWCGNSYYSIFLAPQKFALAKIHRYSGSMKTEMRLKLRTGKKTYYSDPFPGEINPGQLIPDIYDILDHSWQPISEKETLERAFLNY